MKKMILVTFLLFAVSARAESNPIVIFFSGTGSTQTDMDNWEQSAKQQCGTQYHFQGVPYRAGGDYTRAGALSGAAPDIRKLSDAILSNPNQKYIISCHSSGCAGADALAEKVAGKSNYAKNILELNNLEGFRPSPDLQKKIPTTCWSAKNPDVKKFTKRIKIRGSNSYQTISQDPTGLNWGSMSSCGHHEVLTTNTSCRSQWCEHWSLVNKGASASSPNPKDSKTGAFKANLAWLKGCSQSGAPRQAPTNTTR